MDHILGMITQYTSYSQCTCMSINLIVKCSFGIKLHPKQKCYYGSCTQSCSVCP